MRDEQARSDHDTVADGCQLDEGRMLKALRNAWTRLTGDPVNAAAAREAYLAVVAAARAPDLYARYGVPDTVDGRFEMIVLHAVLLVRQTKQQGEAGKRFGRAFMSYLFDDMDRNLREMGTGDMRVGRRIKEMAEAFYGRAKAYQAALDDGEGDGLAEVLARNVYPDAPPAADVDALADLVRRQADRLAAVPVAELLAGKVGFLPLDATVDGGRDKN